MSSGCMNIDKVHNSKQAIQEGYHIKPNRATYTPLKRDLYLICVYHFFLNALSCMVVHSATPPVKVPLLQAATGWGAGPKV